MYNVVTLHRKWDDQFISIVLDAYDPIALHKLCILPTNCMSRLTFLELLVNRAVIKQSLTATP
jgi:hypothetical protein